MLIRYTFKISRHTDDMLSARLFAAMNRIPTQALCHATLGRVVAGCAATRNTRHTTDEKTVYIVDHDSVRDSGG